MVLRLRKIADRPLQSPRVIICEGADEFGIFSWLRSERGLGEDRIELIDAKGRTNLATTLDDLRFQSGGTEVQLVAIVLDAEERRPSDLALLTELDDVAKQRGFKHLVFLLPDEDTQGSLETLVRRSADPAEAAAICAESWAECLSIESDTRTQAQKDKAWGHVWLAGQGEIFSRLGFALVKSASVRNSLPDVVGKFNKILDEALTTSLD